jgi:uncharacterized protein (TIGR02147 family)
MADLFAKLDYRAYLKEWIEEQPNRGRGMIAALAQVARCQPAYFSRVLLGKAQLSPEQAFVLQKTLGHSAEEVSYFMELVDWDRAGDASLKRYHRERIEAAQKAHADLKKRFKTAPQLTREHQCTYYSSPHYIAIHVCVSVGALQTVAELAAFLRLPRDRVVEALKLLEEAGLVVEERGKWKVGQTRLHLGNDSALMRQHHANWRMEAIKSLDRGEGPRDANHLHYSAVVSLSEADAVKLKELFVRALEEFSAVVSPSKEETVRALTLDFFPLG